MTTTETTLRGAVAGDGAERVLTLDPAFQGLPDTAHGGSVLAAFDLVAGGAGARAVAGHYRRRVPLGVPLRLGVARDAGVTRCVVRDGAGAVLVDGEVGPARAGVPAPLAADGPGGGGEPLPVSRTCFACGTDNPLGLRLRLEFDARAVRGAWTPRDVFARPDGALAPVALTTLLDEAAFWLGALATGESGMTTELAVTFHGAARAGGALTVGGARAAVRPRPDDPRYWETFVAAHDAAGALVATAAITFVTIRGAARRLVTGMLAMNPPDVVRRVFPAYAR
jgi:hypothetical protein